MASVLTQFLTEDDIVIEEDLDNRDDQYRDIYTQLDKYTNGFTKESGEFPLDTKSEIENAESILKDHYANVRRSGIVDYDADIENGMMYKISFSEPIEQEVEESLDDLDFVKNNNKVLKYMPDKNPANAKLINGQQAPTAGGMGESLTESPDEFGLPTYKELQIATNKKADKIGFKDAADAHYEMRKLLRSERWNRVKEKEGVAMANADMYYQWITRGGSSAYTKPQRSSRNSPVIVHNRDNGNFNITFFDDGIVVAQNDNLGVKQEYPTFMTFMKDWSSEFGDESLTEGMKLPTYDDLDKARNRMPVTDSNRDWDEYIKMFDLLTETRWKQDCAENGKAYANANEYAQLYNYYEDTNYKPIKKGDSYFIDNIEFLDDGTVNYYNEGNITFKELWRKVDSLFDKHDIYIYTESLTESPDEYGLPTFRELRDAGNRRHEPADKRFEMYVLKSKERWKRVEADYGDVIANADQVSKYLQYIYSQTSVRSYWNESKKTYTIKVIEAEPNTPDHKIIFNDDGSVILDYLTKNVKHFKFNSYKKFIEWYFNEISWTEGTKDHFMNEKVEKHDELNPDLWENNELKPEVKDKLLEIVQRFDDNLKQDGIELDIKDVKLIGSNASYNYNDTSDIDLHIIADTSVYDNEELALKVYQAYKSLWNNKYDPTIYGHEVELYVEPVKEVE